MALISYGWRAEGLYWIGEMGERRGKEEVSFVMSDLSVELSWWL